MTGIRKIQKPTTFIAMITSALVFLLSLGYSTDAYGLYPFTSNRRHLDGAEIYNDIQPFNKLLIILAIVMILICVAMFATLTHKRRLYYKSNIIVSLAYIALTLFVGVFTIVKSVGFINQFYKIDFVQFKELVEMWGGTYTESTVCFDMGIIVGVICILTAGLVALNLYLKLKDMKAEAEGAR
jgi:hypothetical protein